MVEQLSMFLELGYVILPCPEKLYRYTLYQNGAKLFDVHYLDTIVSHIKTTMKQKHYRYNQIQKEIDIVIERFRILEDKKHA